ncbi:hypothetical protein D8M09_13450 [Enterobacter sp. R1(2018)]|nr:hypothetical protein D8M09_13450 [Enterobacter sp. R1(2018)]
MKRASLCLPTEAGENTNQSISGAQGQFINIALIAEKSSNKAIFAYITGGKRRLFTQSYRLLLNCFYRIRNTIGVFCHQRVVFAFDHHAD